MERDGELEAQARTFDVVGPECNRVLVLRRCDGEAVEGEGAVSRRAESEPRPRRNLVVVSTRCAHELERRAPVIGEHLRVVLGASEPIDPLGNGLMPLRALGAWDLAVGHVPDEGVGEGELALTLERGSALTANEALALERVKRR